jgi:predicted P-loop ATPase
MHASPSTNHQQSESFDIRNFIDRLTPTKRKHRYYCPVCDGHNLTINPETGKYQCWNGCECKDIREAIAPWDHGQKPYQPQSPQRPKGSRRSKPKPPPVPAGAKLATLLSPALDIPQPQPLTKKVKGIPIGATETIYNYSHILESVTQVSESPETPTDLPTVVDGENQADIDNDLKKSNSVAAHSETAQIVNSTGLPSQWVVRYDWEDANSKKGRDKTFRQWHRLPDGTPEMKKGDKPWSAYRIEEAIEAAKQVTSGIPALLWQEGEKCVEIARKGAIASLTLQGSAWGKADIKHNLESVKTALPISVQVLLADSDETGRKKAATFSSVCTELGMPYVIVFPHDICEDLPHNASDIEQILGQMNVSEFIRRLEAQIHEAVDAGALGLPSNELEHEEELSPLARKVARLREAWGDRLIYNELTMDIEFDGQPMEWDTLKIDIVEQLNISMSQEDAQQTVMAIARDNRHHPVRDYLESVAARYPYNPERLDNLAKLFFGTEKPIYDIYMKKWLVAGVARILTPGIKVDDSLVLHGEQGVLKSTFFREMAVKDEWFLDSIDLSESEKDTLMKLHKSWITELGEIETLTTKREDAWWKNFSARREDTFRPPYGRRPKTMKRRFVIVGTTNREEFLNDPTGNRRFWIIAVGNKRINIELVQLLRDELWANAVHAYRAGDVLPYLNEKENALRAIENSRFQIDDPWEGLITQYLLPRVQVTIPEIATNCLGVDIDKQDKRLQGRIADVIRKLGWVKDTRRINGKTVKCWVRPEGTLPPLPPSEGVVTEGGNAFKPLSDKDLPSSSIATVTTPETNFENSDRNSELRTQNQNPNQNQDCNNFGKVGSEVVTHNGDESEKRLHSNGSEVLPPLVTTPLTLKGCNIPVCLGAWVKCYPTYEHAQHGWEVRAQIVDLKVEDSYFNGCTVRYFDRKKQHSVDVKLAGGNGNWLLTNLS